ncbi:hypothetical protein [Arabiibacter massiliensis]|uniref:hypothetical protein n=1 Tax=Arabiibacter massiliensis TaxID=1870985 RepID=UPI0009B9342D|nr:hypothetical protein [Arabiibacter massiliensis]
MHDVGLLLWLRVRHARWTANRLLHLVGAGIEEGGALDRVYQLYAVGLFAVWFALMAAALVDAVAAVFAGAGVAACALAVRAALIAAVLLFARIGIGGARTSPLKLSHPDIAHVAASPVGARALTGVAAGAQVLGGVLAGGAVGFLLGVGLESAGVAAAAVPAAALACAALAGAAVAAGWAVGVVRLASPRWSRGKTAAAMILLVVLAAVWIAFAVCADSSLLLVPAAAAALGAGAALALAAAAAMFALMAPRIDMTRVIEESALFADLCGLDPLSPLSWEQVAEHQRRRKLADRAVRFSLPPAEGRRTLVARAALSHLRQWDGIPALLVQGALVVPLGVLAVLGAGGPVLFLFWLQALMMMKQGVREASRPFRDDVRVRLVRDRLPFGTLELLVWDALPAFVLTTALACGVSLIAAPAGASLPAAVALAVLLNAGSLLSCGFDAVRLFPNGPRLCYEQGALVLAAASFALWLFAPLPVVVAGIALATAAIAAAVHFGAECAR